MTNDIDNNKEKIVHVYPPKIIVLYTIFIAGILCTIFLLLFANTPYVNDSSSTDNIDQNRNLIYSILLMIAAGGIGGCLYNFRGLIKHSTDADYKNKYDLSYYLRPIAGAISGLIIFFLLLGGALTFNIENISNNNSGIPNWATFAGRMPYIVFALLAGYSSHEFMLKMKDISESIFALRGSSKDKNNRVDK